MNNYIGLKGFSSTLSPLPEHLQMRVMEEHGIANMMKQPACNRATDAIYAITSPVNGWRSGQSAEIWNQRLNLILMVLDCHQYDKFKPVNKTSWILALDMFVYHFDHWDFGQIYLSPCVFFGIHTLIIYNPSSMGHIWILPCFWFFQ